MLAYAANAPRHAERRSSPNAMLIVISAHVALVAIVMSARIDLPRRIFHAPTTITFIDLPKEPPPQSTRPKADTPPKDKWADLAAPQAQTPALPSQAETPDTTTVDTGTLIGGGNAILPELPPSPGLDPVKVGPQLLTPAAELKPPYPHEKLLTEEEAVLKLKLTIDARGRVIGVDPLGRADPVFLRASRQYLLAHWRYRPASEDGRAVTSSTVITLHFTLEG